MFTSGLLDQIDVELAEPIRVMLFQDSSADSEHTYVLPAWLATDAVIARMNVSIAVGQLMEAGVLTDDEALATLRGYAFTHNTTLDEVALQLTTYQVHPDILLGRRPRGLLVPSGSGRSTFAKA